MTYVRVYYCEMKKMVHDEKLLMQFFHESLSDTCLSWYIKLDNIKVNK